MLTEVETKHQAEHGEERQEIKMRKLAGNKVRTEIGTCRQQQETGEKAK